MKIYNELESLGFFKWLSETHNLIDTDMKPEYLDELPLNDIHITVCNSMALRWFREKYDLTFTIKRYFNCYNIIEILEYNSIDDDNVDIELDGLDWKDFKIYEEAEHECLKQLIKLVKNNK